MVKKLTIREGVIGLCPLALFHVKAVLAALQKNKSIRLLNLQNMLLTDKDVPLLVALLKPNQNLLTLDIRNTQITPKGAEDLAKGLRLRRASLPLTIFNPDGSEVKGMPVISEIAEVTSAAANGLPNNNGEREDDGSQRIPISDRNPKRYLYDSPIHKPAPSTQTGEVKADSHGQLAAAERKAGGDMAQGDQAKDGGSIKKATNGAAVSCSCNIL